MSKTEQMLKRLQNADVLATPPQSAVKSDRSVPVAPETREVVFTPVRFKATLHGETLGWYDTAKDAEDALDKAIAEEDEED